MTSGRGASAWVAPAVAVVAALVVVAGLVPPQTAADALVRVAPVLLFLVAVTVLAELSDQAEVFDVAARRAARAARGRVPLLFLLVAALATLTTVLLSLDTTAVLLTPVVLTLCVQLDLDPLPFALATVTLANTASLLLPVSNLTNLLAVRRLDLGALEYAGRMWLPELAAVTGTLLVLGLLHHRRLRGRFTVPRAPAPADRWLFGVCAVACAGFAVLVLAGADVTLAAVAAAVPAVAVFAVRRRRALTPALVPWRLVLLVAGLFVIIEAAERHGLERALSDVAGQGTGWAALLQVAGAGAVAANLVNNLPAYLALEPVAGEGDRLLALLVGVGAGPLVLTWGSLATLLWLDRCRARGIRISAWTFARTGLLVAPVAVVAAVTALVI